MASLHAGKLGGVREYLQSSLICHPHDWLNALVMQPCNQEPPSFGSLLIKSLHFQPEVPSHSYPAVIRPVV